MALILLGGTAGVSVSTGRVYMSIGADYAAGGVPAIANPTALELTLTRAS